MADQHAGHRRAEAVPAQLQRLPHARTHHEVDLRRRRVHAGLPAHEPATIPASTPLQPQRLAGNAGRDIGNGAAGAAGRRMARQHQLEPAGDLELPAQDAAAAHRQVHPRHHHRIRSAGSQIQPHDVMLDHEGNVWYSDFGQMFLGKMDPKTGKVTQYPIPVVKPGWSARHARSRNRQGRQSLGRRDVPERDREVRPEDRKIQDLVDAEGMGHRRRPARPSRASTARPSTTRCGSRTPTAANIYRLDLATNKFENLGAPKDPRTGKRIGTYGIHSDAQNNALSARLLGRQHRQDRRQDRSRPTVYLTPTPNSHPRRGRVDDQGRLWFAEYRGNAIGMLDPKSGKIKEWKVPTRVERALRRGVRQERRCLDRLDAHRPRVAARRQDRAIHRIHAAASDQHPPRLCRRQRRTPARCGSAATTARRSSRSSRWIDLFRHPEVLGA